MVKPQVTIRLPGEILAGLRVLAKKKRTSVSALVEGAVNQLLASQSEGGSGTNSSEMDPSLTVEDVERLLAVLKAFGRPMSLTLVLNVIREGRDATK